MWWDDPRSSFLLYHSRPDGEKKAYVRLAPDYDALDVANKVRKLTFIYLANAFQL